MLKNIYLYEVKKIYQQLNINKRKKNILNNIIMICYHLTLIFNKILRIDNYISNNNNINIIFIDNYLIINISLKFKKQKFRLKYINSKILNFKIYNFTLFDCYKYFINYFLIEIKVIAIDKIISNKIKDYSFQLLKPIIYSIEIMKKFCYSEICISIFYLNFKIIEKELGINLMKIIRKSIKNFNLEKIKIINLSKWIYKNNIH